MKRLFSLLLVVSLLLTGCTSSNKIPDGMTEEVYDIGVNATTEVDKHLDDETSAGELYNYLSELYIEFHEDPNEVNAEVRYYLALLMLDAQNIDSSSESTSKLQKDNNELKKVLDLE